MKQPSARELKEFLLESNAIEGVFGFDALNDATEAWEYAMTQEKMTPVVIRSIHQILMQNLEPRIAGRFRNCAVWIGGHEAPPYYSLDTLIAGWVKTHSRAKTVDNIKRAHVAFEKIHPFEDGNGRTGRIILNWQRVKNGLSLLVIHTGEEQMQYYKWFKK